MSNQEFVRANDKTMPADYFAAPLMQGETIEGAVVVFQDATLRRQYEAAMASAQQNLERLVTERTQQLSKEVDIRAKTEVALRDSRARMKGITDCLLEGVLVVNVGGDLMFTNPEARRLLNVEGGDDLEGLPIDDLFVLDGDPPIPFQHSPFNTVIVRQTPIKNDDAAFLTHDKRTLSVAYACSPLIVEGGGLAAVILFRDIHELKAAQWDALQASRLASVGQLAAGIAHEINTPIQYIGDNLRFINDALQSYQKIVFAAQQWVEKTLADHHDDTALSLQEMFEEEDIAYLNDEAPTAIAQSQQGADQVRHIVLSMKEFSHPGSTSKIMTDINWALESTLTVCRNTWKHVANVEMDFAPDLPHILCYSSELNQVFLNLIINATHAIEESVHGGDGLGLIKISTRAEGDWIEIRVSDTGNGVPAAILDRIFDPFFTTKAVGKGTGQGLAISRDVVINKHQGRLDVESVDGVGATFIVRLPVVSPEEEWTKEQVS